MVNDEITRRNFLIAAGEVSLLAAGATILTQTQVAQAVPATTRVDSVPTGITRTWLGTRVLGQPAHGLAARTTAASSV